MFTGRFGAFFFAALFLFCILDSYLIADPDLFARVATGRLVEILGYMPLHDPFSFTPKNPQWVDHEWLSGVIFYKLASLGDGALFMFGYLIAVWTLLFIYRAYRVNGGDERFPLWIFLIFVIGTSYLWQSVVRAQVFTYFFLSYLIFSMLVYRRQAFRRYLALMPFITICWVNMHGGVVLGLLFLAIFVGSLVCERIRNHASPSWLFPFAILLLCLLATFVNPYGLSYWSFITEAILMKRPNITEWQSVSLNDLGSLYVHLFLIIGILSALIYRDIIFYEAYVFLILGAYFGYKHARFAALPMIVVFTYMPVGIDWFARLVCNVLAGWYIRLRRSAMIGIVIFTVVILVHFFWTLITLSSFRLDYTPYPVASLEWLRANREGGRVLVGFNEGSYALWRLFPKFLVSLDGRYEEVYPEYTVELVMSALDPNNPRQKKSIKEINPDYILTRNSKILGGKKEIFKGRWCQIYRDDSYLIFAKERCLKEAADFHMSSVPFIWKPNF
ncbi:MAG: hypothetical protein D6808_02370 [Candidatus Dadabacteria bacterium]|nr:MAG: hypothetical protein D6808_02370 [Candidatus Dadabacteria bacterium]